MGLFGDLISSIFHGGAVAEHPVDAVPAGQEGRGPIATAPRPAAAQTATATVEQVDVEAILDRRAAESNEKLSWRSSIVDLMKLVGMDSSLANRKALAAELHYTGDTHDSAAMNVWLHKQVMKKLAENGGRVPADLLD